MVAIGRSSHAFFFDGVSDSVIIPQGRFTKTGVKDADGNKADDQDPTGQWRHRFNQR